MNIFKFNLIMVFIIAMIVVCGVVCAADEITTNTTTISTVSLDFKNISVIRALEAIFTGSGTSYGVQEGVTGVIPDLKLSNVSIEQAVKLVTQSVGASYTLEDGVYLIVPKPVVSSIKSATGGVIANAGNSTQTEEAPAEAVQAPDTQQIVQAVLDNLAQNDPRTQFGYQGQADNGYIGYPARFDTGQVRSVPGPFIWTGGQGSYIPSNVVASSTYSGYGTYYGPVHPMNSPPFQPW